MLLACVSGAAACTWVCTLSTAVLPRASTSASVLRANGRVCKCQRRANGRRANIGHPCAMHEAGGTQVCTTSTDLCMHKCVCKSARTQGVCVCVCVCMWVCTHDACKGRCVHPLCIQVCALRVCVCTGAQEVCSGGVHPCLCTRECASVCMHREHTHTSALWVCKCKRVHEPCKGRRELCKKGGCAKVCMKLCTHKRAPGARASPCTRSVCKCKREHDLCTAARARGAHTCECCGAQHVHERARLCTPRAAQACKALHTWAAHPCLQLH